MLAYALKVLGFRRITGHQVVEEFLILGANLDRMAFGVVLAVGPHQIGQSSSHIPFGFDFLFLNDSPEGLGFTFVQNQEGRGFVLLVPFLVLDGFILVIPSQIAKMAEVSNQVILPTASPHAIDELISRGDLAILDRMIDSITGEKVDSFVLFLLRGAKAVTFGLELGFVQNFHDVPFQKKKEASLPRHAYQYR